MIRILQPPFDVDDEPLAAIDLGCDELTARFGAGWRPTGNDALAFPGPVVIWGLLCDDGQTVCLEHHLAKGFTHLLANPRDLDRALSGTSIDATHVTWRQIGPR